MNNTPENLTSEEIIFSKTGVHMNTVELDFDALSYQAILAILECGGISIQFLDKVCSSVLLQEYDSEKIFTSVLYHAKANADIIRKLWIRINTENFKLSKTRSQFFYLFANFICYCKKINPIEKQEMLNTAIDIINGSNDFPLEYQHLNILYALASMKPVDLNEKLIKHIIDTITQKNSDGRRKFNSHNISRIINKILEQMGEYQYPLDTDLCFALIKLLYPNNYNESFSVVNAIQNNAFAALAYRIKQSNKPDLLNIVLEFEILDWQAYPRLVVLMNNRRSFIRFILLEDNIDIDKVQESEIFKNLCSSEENFNYRAINY